MGMKAVCDDCGKDMPEKGGFKIEATPILPNGEKNKDGVNSSVYLWGEKSYEGYWVGKKPIAGEYCSIPCFRERLGMKTREEVEATRDDSESVDDDDSGGGGQSPSRIERSIQSTSHRRSEGKGHGRSI